MLRLSFASLVITLVLSVCLPAAHAQSGLVSQTGNLLKGTVYKRTGVERSGIITVKTKWNLPAIAPVYRFDFDMLHGLIDKGLYSFIVGDIAEMTFMDSGGDDQVVTIKLRNGVTHKLTLTSEKKALLGPVKLWMDEVRVLTGSYGENIIPASEVGRIVFDPPSTVEEQDMEELADELGKAIEVGVRDDLVNDDLAVVLENIQKKFKARLRHEERIQD